MKKFGLAACLVAGIGMAGCNGGTTFPGTSLGPKQTIGGVGGAVAGGLLGNQIGKGSGRTAATIAGALLGAIAGGAIGAQMDAQDRQLAYRAQYTAFEANSYTPVRRSWRNTDTGNYGTVRAGKAFETNGNVCREYTHTVYIDGTPETARGTACKSSSDRTWRII